MEINPLVGSVASGFGAQAPQMPHGDTSKSLKEASRDFVSVLYSYMFTTMRGNPDENNDEDSVGGSLFGGENVNMFMGFLDQEVGKKFAEQGGKDTVDALYHQLKGHNVYEDEKVAEKNSSQSALTGNKLSESILKTTVANNAQKPNVSIDAAKAELRLNTNKEGTIIEPSKKENKLI